MHQLHAKCDNRIKYQKVCPVHGVVESDEIVSGIELSPGKFVVVEPDELDEVRNAADKSIQIDKFVELSAVDPLYYSGDTYFLAPDGDAGLKPYTVFLRSMEEEGRVAIGQAVFFGRERLVLLRPLDGVLSVTMLKYESELRTHQSLLPLIEATEVNKKELELADSLIETAMSDSFDIHDYQDLYTERLQEVVDAKVAGKQLVPSTDEQAPPVINLMEALKRSLAGASKPKNKTQNKTQNKVRNKTPKKAVNGRKTHARTG
jgi:DNA end-binding protein Ku